MSVRRFVVALVPAVVCLASAPVAFADDPPAKETEKAKDQGHMMMDHSKGDQKSMSRMKDKTIPIHHEGDAATAKDPNAPKEHIMMDHSPGDTKSMSRMKDKNVPIHHDGDPSTAKADGKEHIMMDHSPGDTKSMSHMKNKTVKTHKNGESTGEGANTGKTDK